MGEDAHGTAPFCVGVYTVRSRLERRLIAGPATRYTSPGKGFGETCCNCIPSSGMGRDAFDVELEESSYSPLGGRAARADYM